MKNTEITTTDNNSVDSFIGQAISKGASIETLEKLLTMRRELKAERAKEEFDSAMSKFQGACPIIKKEKIVKNKDGSVRYRYAPLDSIVKQVKKLIQDNGFSYTINALFEENGITAICRVTHETGHSQESTFKAKTDPEAFMNIQQKSGSALTFAKRYAFCNAFGILTGDEDNDAATAGKPKKEQDQYATALTMIAAAKTEAMVMRLVERIQKSPKFTAEQKKELDKLASARVDVLDNEKATKK